MRPEQNSAIRLAELEFRFNLQRSVDMALASAGIELDEADAEKLRIAQRQAQDEVRRKITQIQQEANLKVLGGVLSSAKVERLMGEAFSFEAGAITAGGDRVEVPRNGWDEPRQDSDDRGRSRRDRRRLTPR